MPTAGPAASLNRQGRRSLHSERRQGRDRSRRSPEALTPQTQPRNTMAGTNPFPNAHGGHPIRIPPVRPLYRVAARGLGASMWFFLMFRAYHDGQALIGLKHPWDH